MSTLHADGEIIDRQTVRFERLLPGPIEHVWPYLTESEKRWGENAEDSEVTFELQPRGNHVLLTVTHRRLADRDFMVSVAGGWHVHLDILADHLNGRVPPPFWATHARLAAEYGKRIPAE